LAVAATKEGTEAIGRVAAGLRFSLFGRTRAARRRLWRALHDASCARSVTAAIAAEAPRYMQVVGRLAYSDGLPRLNIALHRLVLVPRAMIAGHARVALFKRLGEVPELAALDESVRLFFFDQIVIEMDAALKGVPVSPRSCQAQDEWACVGISKDVEWADPLWSAPTASATSSCRVPRGTFAQDRSHRGIHSRDGRRRHVAQQDSRYDGPHGVRRE
jgi:hypothetical protein